MTICRLRPALAAEALGVLCFASACVSDADPPLEGGGASGGSTAAGGTTSTGNAGTGGGTSPGNGGGGANDDITSDPAFGAGIPCLPVTQALISDFTPPPNVTDPAALDAGSSDAAAPAVTAITFGDFTSAFSGGTYHYPGAGMYAVTSDMSGGAWHVTGNIGDFSGLGLYLSIPPTAENAEGGCNLIDASAYGGISFTISGNVAMGGFLQFMVGTSEDQISHLWLNANVAGSMEIPNSGTCVPVSGQYDGTCTTPSFNVPVTAEPTQITVLWEDLIGGLPRPSVDPAKITSIVWIFPSPPGAGTGAPMPYAADVTIDDLSFVP